VSDGIAAEFISETEFQIAGMQTMKRLPCLAFITEHVSEAGAENGAERARKSVSGSEA